MIEKLKVKITGKGVKKKEKKKGGKASYNTGYATHTCHFIVMFRIIARPCFESANSAVNIAFLIIPSTHTHTHTRSMKIHTESDILCSFIARCIISYLLARRGVTSTGRRSLTDRLQRFYPQCTGVIGSVQLSPLLTSHFQLWAASEFKSPHIYNTGAGIIGRVLLWEHIHYIHTHAHVRTHTHTAYIMTH